MKGKFIKTEPTKDGLTLILKAEKTKENMRLAVDLMDEECTISKGHVASGKPAIQEFFDSIAPILEEFIIRKLRDNIAKEDAVKEADIKAD